MRGRRPFAAPPALNRQEAQETAVVAVPPTARPTLPAVRIGFLAVPVIALIVLVAGATGMIDPELALAAGAGGAAGWAGALLIRTALRIHHADRSFAACKGAGFVGLSAVATGFTVAVPAVGPPGAGLVATLGLGAAAVFSVIGTMLLPGAATTWPVRLRRAFDGLGLGVSLGFAAWLIPPVYP